MPLEAIGISSTTAVVRKARAIYAANLQEIKDELLNLKSTAESLKQKATTSSEKELADNLALAIDNALDISYTKYYG